MAHCFTADLIHGAGHVDDGALGRRVEDIWVATAQSVDRGYYSPSEMPFLYFSRSSLKRSMTWIE